MTLLGAPVLKDPVINQPKLTTLQEQLTGYHYCIPTMLSLTTFSGHKATYQWVQEAWGSGVQLRLFLSPFWLLLHQHCHSRTHSFHQHSPTFLMVIQTMLWPVGPPYHVPWYRHQNHNIHRRCVIAQLWITISQIYVPTDHRLGQGTHSCSIISACGRLASCFVNNISRPESNESAEMIRIAVGYRLGLWTCEPHTCSCGKDVDARGLHGLSCRRSSARQQQHARLNDVIWRYRRTFRSCSKSGDNFQNH